MCSFSRFRVLMAKTGNAASETGVQARLLLSEFADKVARASK